MKRRWRSAIMVRRPETRKGIYTTVIYSRQATTSDPLKLGPFWSDPKFKESFLGTSWVKCGGACKNSAGNGNRRPMLDTRTWADRDLLVTKSQTLHRRGNGSSQLVDLSEVLRVVHASRPWEENQKRGTWARRSQKSKTLFMSAETCRWTRLSRADKNTFPIQREYLLSNESKIPSEVLYYLEALE